MGKVCSWSGDDSGVCKCHRCKKPEAQPLDVVGVDTHSHVGKLSILPIQIPELKTYHGKPTDIKIDYSLIPLDGLEELALAYTIGGKKHKHRPDVDPTTDDEEFAAIMRHLVAWRRGAERDPEGHHHLAAVMARCAKLITRSNHGRKTKVVAGNN